jgi:hypothetical protein
MSDLHPAARALIDAAKRGEAAFPLEARSRVHRSVLRRALTLGAAVATASTASAASKAATLVAGLTSAVAVPSVLGAVAAVAFFVLRAGSTTHEPRSSSEPAPTHAIARPVPNPEPSTPAPPALVSPAFSTVSHDAVALAPDAPASVTVSPPLVLAARPPAAPAASSRPTTAAEVLPVPPAVEAVESPAVKAAVKVADEPLRTSTATPIATPGARTPIAASALADDLDVLRQVHAALRGRRSEAALSLLDRAGPRLETGPLAEEAQGARVSTLCQLGRIADARAATDRLLVAWPTSPLAMRLRGGCDALGVNLKPDAN